MLTFSIILPVYNVAPYLEACLASVCKQSFADWECICVDDGSTDGSGEILDAYAAKDKRFRVFHQANAGVSAARNLALDHVRGAYVAFIDGDDWILEDWLETIHRLIVQTPGVDWIRLENRDFKAGACVIKEASLTRVDKLIHADEMLLFGWDQIVKNSLPFVNIYRQSLLQHHRFNGQLSMREDAIFELSLLPLISTCRYFNYDGYVYRMLETSATRRKKSVMTSVHFEQALLEVWKAQQKLFSWSLRRKIRHLYTFLVYKDMTQWYSVRDREAKEDGKALQRVCFRAWRAGAIAFALWRRKLLTRRKYRMRLFRFLLTGNLQTLVGRKRDKHN